MATKRPVQPDSDTTTSSSKRQKFVHGVRRPNHGTHSFKKAHAVNDLKSTVRSIRRLLERNEDLPAGVRVEKERQLQTAQRELDKQQRAKKRSDIVGKWHKIRFFDRRKAERRLKKAKRELQEARDGNGDAVDMVKKVEDCEVNVAYAIYFPLEQDYIPLYSRKAEVGEGPLEDGEDNETEWLGDRDMRETVKSCMRDGTLQQLRDGKVGGVEMEKLAVPVGRPGRKNDASTSSIPDARKVGRVRPNGAEEEAAEGSDEDGLGFFE